MEQRPFIKVGPRVSWDPAISTGREGTLNYAIPRDSRSETRNQKVERERTAERTENQIPDAHLYRCIKALGASRCAPPCPTQRGTPIARRLREYQQPYINPGREERFLEKSPPMAALDGRKEWSPGTLIYRPSATTNPNRINSCTDVAACVPGIFFYAEY
ncbi:hypothetical protein K0M31_011446 [Melipona bicolor]|uniref:Uncharacterized protein n=1 Tax=Melipona bicolor TaxID=60889 RepID=A0AA40G9J1_9HYME|nr:hypothetical protein K0M31_011446 [Melipona bicolor]